MPTTEMKPKRKKKTKRVSEAKKADRHILYQKAVQCVEAEIDFVDETYESLRHRKAVTLREDFCGTANTSCEWVRRRDSNNAVGLDIDRETLRWGMDHNVSSLDESQTERLRLVEADVLDPPELGRFDVILAMNFSYWCFKQRKTLKRYFETVRSSLAEGGLFILDFYGGSDALVEMKEEKEIEDEFTYIWDQASYNPITGDLVCHIHFKFPDGSRIRKAFTYCWRLWTLPELRDLLADAGFARTTVYWEGEDPDSDGGNGEFEPTEVGDACDAYVAYIVAET